MIAGLELKQKGQMQQNAWMLSHQLIAAGCKAEDVTPAKLLGEKEKRTRRAKVVTEAEKPAAVDRMFKKWEASQSDGRAQSEASVAATMPDGVPVVVDDLPAPDAEALKGA